MGTLDPPHGFSRVCSAWFPSVPHEFLVDVHHSASTLDHPTVSRWLRRSIPLKHTAFIGLAPDTRKS